MKNLYSSYFLLKSRFWNKGCTRSTYSKKKISMDPTTKWPYAKNSQATCQDIEAYKILIKRFKCKISFFEFGLHQKNLLKKHILPESNQTVMKEAIDIFVPKWKTVYLPQFAKQQNSHCHFKNMKCQRLQFFSRSRNWKSSYKNKLWYIEFDRWNWWGRGKNRENKIGCLMIWCHEQDKNLCLFMGFHIYFRLQVENLDSFCYLSILSNFWSLICDLFTT